MDNPKAKELYAIIFNRSSCLCRHMFCCCAPTNSNSHPPSKTNVKELKKPLSPNENLISRSDCKITLSSGALENVKVAENIKDSTSLKFELLPDSRVKVDQDFTTCLPPFNPLTSCRTSHEDPAYTNYTALPNGFMLKDESGGSWAFISANVDGKTANGIFLDGSFKELFGKQNFELAVERCQ